MSIKDAEKILLEKFPKAKLISVVDYNNYYVFNTDSKKSIKPLIAVTKDEGRIMTFNPLYHGSDEYIKAVRESISYY